MSVSDVKERVQTFLTKNLANVTVDKDGDFSIRHDSARVFVRTRGWREESTLITVFAAVVSGVTPSPELDHYIAYNTDDFAFGHLSLTTFSDGTTSIILSHRLLGDFLDEEELLRAVYGVAFTANDLDDELVSKFGGKVFHD